MKKNTDPLSIINLEFDSKDIPWIEGQSIFNWWVSAKGENKFPSRKDFNPMDFPKALPFIFIVDVKYKNKEPDFFIRLSGSEVSTTLGLKGNGENIKTIENGENIHHRFCALIKEEKPYLIKNNSFIWNGKDYVNYSAITLPLSSDGIIINKLLIYSNY